MLARKDNEIALFAKQAKLYKEKWATLEKDLKKYQKQLQVRCSTSVKLDHP